MFSNFIYFIVVLLIYTTYQLPEETWFTPSETALLFFLLFATFVILTRISFQRLTQRLSGHSLARSDHHFNQLLTRQSVMAIVLFTLDIYGLNLPDYVRSVPLFVALPTLEALIFLVLFLGYLTLIWSCAYRAYQRIYTSTVSRRTYILSNISFAIPILVPWLCLSGLADLIETLPFEPLRQFLATPQGQVIYFLVFLIAVAVVGPLLIRTSWRCTSLEPGHMRSRIEKLCRRAGLEYADIVYWPIFEGRMITAGVMGLVKRFRYILVTDALLTVLRPEEIDAVIAHEIGHIRRKHLLFYLIFFVGYMLIAYATFDLIVYLIIYTEPVYRFILSAGFSQATVTSILFTLVTVFIFLIYFRYIFGYFMRNFERQADCYVYTLFDSAMPLISTFEKITMTSGQSPDRPNWHHFSITERVRYLLRCERDKTWIRRQDRKIRRSIAVYLAGMVMAGFVGYSLNFGETGQAISANVFEKVLVREIGRSPGNSDLYSLLGDLYYSRGKFRETIGAYEKAITLKPDRSETLNNLAWVYATCEVPGLRNPERALALALKASELSQDPHIIDTLAESYYINGRFEAAVSAGEQALKKVIKDRSHFEAQLKKFRKALERPENG